jgi:hypothetical protein
VTPWDTLAGLLTAALVDVDDEPTVNVYPTPTEQVVADAVVIRPDTPWIAPGDVWMGEERYAVVCLVSAGTPADGLARLHSIVHTVLDAARSASWEFDNVSPPVVDESTGTPFLAATVSLIYRNCEE